MTVSQTKPQASAESAVPEDAAILAAIAEGRTGPFHVLVERYKLPVYRYLLGQTSSPEVAEDLAQDVFLRVYRAAGAGAYAGKASVKTWLFTIAGNRVRDFWRSAGRKREVTDSGLVASKAEVLASGGARLAQEAVAELGRALGSCRRPVRGSPAIVSTQNPEGPRPIGRGGCRTGGGGDAPGEAAAARPAFG